MNHLPPQKFQGLNLVPQAQGRGAWPASLAAVLCLCLWRAGSLAAAEEPSAVVPDAGWVSSIVSLVESGGWTMIPIFLAMLLGLTFAGERWMATRRSLLDPPRFEEKLLQTLTVLGADDALKMCAQNNTVLSRVIGHAIKRYKFDIATLREAVLDQCARENLRLKSPLRVVSLMGQILPMLGLFGTVVGMIQAFRTIGQSTNGVTDYAHLGESISVALVTTLFGLLFAIPLLVGYYYLRGRIDNGIQRVETVASGLVDEILLREVHHMRLEKDLQATVETRELPVSRLAEEVDLSDEFAEEGSFKSSITTPAQPTVGGASPGGGSGEAAGSRMNLSPNISQHITSANISGIGRHAIAPVETMGGKPGLVTKTGAGAAPVAGAIPSPERLPTQSAQERKDNLDNATKGPLGPKVQRPE